MTATSSPPRSMAPTGERELMCSALVGSNPLGFLAALGLIDVLARAVPDAQPTLRWEGTLRPQAAVGGLGELDRVVEAVMTDRDRWNRSVVLEGPDGERPLDIKPEVDQVGPWFRAAATSEHPGDLPLLHGLISEGAVAGKGDSKPTHLHFTAGQQKFLAMVRDLRDNLTDDHVVEALIGPWRYESALPVLGWDGDRSERLHALSRKSPASEKKLGVPGAEWLAFLGLRYLPVATTARLELVTTCCAPAWKAGGHLTWPLWERPAGDAAIAALLRSDFFGLDPDQRRERGLSGVLRAPIRRADQGGYGSFGPTSPV
ncbi:MAG: hypothetical protein KDB24_16010 [Microthrixaceae bacterium]|nr:hypothetical protein [Microthrixaceae bacterium]